jgi:hypothetical protein
VVLTRHLLFLNKNYHIYCHLHVGESTRAADIEATADKLHDDRRRQIKFKFGTLFGGLDGARIAWSEHDHIFGVDRIEADLDPQRTCVQRTFTDFYRLPDSTWSLLAFTLTGLVLRANVFYSEKKTDAS